jgi:hypothetical protein
MSKGVKMMHIVCHGIDTEDEKNTDNKDYSKLKLEDDKEVGLQDDKFSAS